MRSKNTELILPQYNMEMLLGIECGFGPMICQTMKDISELTKRKKSNPNLIELAILSKHGIFLIGQNERSYFLKGP